MCFDFKLVIKKKSHLSLKVHHMCSLSCSVFPFAFRRNNAISIKTEIFNGPPYFWPCHTKRLTSKSPSRSSLVSVCPNVRELSERVPFLGLVFIYSAQCGQWWEGSQLGKVGRSFCRQWTGVMS